MQVATILHLALIGQTSEKLLFKPDPRLGNSASKAMFFQIRGSTPSGLIEPMHKQSYPANLNTPTTKLKFDMNNDKANFFMENRRNRYSSLWAFTSLNYLYADLVGLMDKNVLSQYQEGFVGGMQITPAFLTTAAMLMQIPLSNVFLPQVIKNERTLKWVQVASGIAMTLIQTGTLFLGKPTSYYALFSVIEIGVTSYIAFDALKWKPKRILANLE